MRAENGVFGFVESLNAGQRITDPATLVSTMWRLIGMFAVIVERTQRLQKG
jgi:hypothetical protein